MPGKNKEPLLIVDADAIIALSNIEDANHQKAKHILEELSAAHAATLFPTTALCEAVTVLRSKLNRPDEAKSVIVKLQRGDFPIQGVDQVIFTEAAVLFQPHASKKNTLFDAVVAVIAKRLNADAIFSFDQWYTKIGLLLTDDFIAKRREAA